MRRVVIVGLALVFLAALLVSEGQQAGKVYRLGFLGMAPGPDGRDTRLEIFRQGLRDLGYFEGRNIVLEVRYPEGKLERLPDLAAELARARTR